MRGFIALVAAVYHPHRVAGRWAGQCAERRVTWPWRRRQCKFFALYRVGKMLKSVSVFLKCTVFNASGAEVSRPHRVAGRAGPGNAPKGASPGLGGGGTAIFCVVSCWQNVTLCEGLLEMPSFQCIGGGSVPPPISCQTLGRAAR